MNKMRINLEELLVCLSNAQDLVSNDLTMHHQKVAYIAFRLAEQSGLTISQRKEAFLAALVHDIGALSIEEIHEIRALKRMNLNEHAFRGAKLLEKSRHLKKSSKIIRFHHVSWDYGEGRQYKGTEVPLLSHLLNLSDYICTRLSPNQNVITQLPGILSDIIEKTDSVFKPSFVDALLEISKKEYIWLDLVSSSPIKKIPDIGAFNILILDTDDVVDLASVFSQIIDFRSRFTSRHSAGVATTAELLAVLAGLSPDECKMMSIAGNLHDLGKIAISKEVLEKPAKLNEEEFNEMRSHTYFTYNLLEPIEQFKTINIWASFHHERLDGNGYPFHIKGENLPLGSRIMAVADVFTAITENRPYRKGMEDDRAKKVLRNMVDNGGIDGRLVELLIDHFKEINGSRVKAQEEAAKRYEKFLKTE